MNAEGVAYCFRLPYHVTPSAFDERNDVSWLSS